MLESCGPLRYFQLKVFVNLNFIYCFSPQCKTHCTSGVTLVDCFVELVGKQVQCLSLR